MSQYAHKGHDPTPAGDEQQWIAWLDVGPDEIPANGPAQFNRVVWLQFAGEELGNLTVLETLHGKF
jgi:hypothetical protein